MQQDAALEILKSGKNLFLTGAAGTGKTHVLKQFIEYLQANDIPHAVTASTGIAATHLNGQTIHSWAGIGIKNSITMQEINNLKKHIKYNFKTVKVLIIDEISMLHACQLEMVDKIARQIRYFKDKPFGGIQIVVCGDFCQLPPVANHKQDVVFAYESGAWINSDFNVCYLQRQYRQDENGLLTILNEIRENRNLSHVRDECEALVYKQQEHNSMITKLHTNNINVDAINHKELNKINTPSFKFEMAEWGNYQLIEGLKKRCLAKEILELKIGALVIFIQNDPEKQYVNGTLGVVTGFTSNGRNPVVRTKQGQEIYVTTAQWKVEDDKGKPLAIITQMPLCLAWAITVHKSQGMTLDAAEIDLSKAFCYGLGYVALSRVKSYDGLKLLGFNQKALQIDPKLLEQDKIFKKESVCQSF